MQRGIHRVGEGGMERERKVKKYREEAEQSGRRATGKVVENMCIY